MSRRVSLLVVSVVLFAGTVELTVRVVRPQPRTQVIDVEQTPFTLSDGVPLWDPNPALSEVLDGRDCVGDPDATQVLLAGDSVMRVGGYDAFGFEATAPVEVRRVLLAQHLTLRLQSMLEAGGGRWCVRNVSQSGYLPYQSVAAARNAHTAHPGDIVVLGIFKSEGRYTLIDGDLYALDGLVRTASGLPALPLPLPDALHGALFHASAAWRYATLALGRVDQTEVAEDPSWREGIAWAEAQGLGVVLLDLPYLDRPFGVDDDPRTRWKRALRAWAAERELPWVSVTEAFAGLDVEAIRLDTCCHFREPGHAALAEALAPAVREAAERRR